MIRPFVTGRKNWLFADTAKGANASARVYSIVETAKANGLDVLKYLEELLLNMPSWDHTKQGTMLLSVYGRHINLLRTRHIIHKAMEDKADDKL